MTYIPTTSVIQAPPSGQTLTQPTDPVTPTVVNADTGTAPNAEAHSKSTAVVQGVLDKASMSAEQFLARVVGPGNYACITWKAPDRGMVQRFFPRDRLSEAARLAKWAAGKGADAYFALAGYN